jgi:hypothetical protein
MVAWVMQEARFAPDFVPVGGNCAANCILSAHRATTPTLSACWESQMTAPMLQLCWAAAVTLALYAFYCHWEAGRADLAASFRHLVPGLPSSAQPGPAGAGLRVRARWAGMGSLLVALGSLVSVL